MSVQALSWVLDKSKSRLAARLVLLSIANHANQDGEQAWPSIPTIAREAHVSERQAQRAILDLCVLGELLVCLKGGPGSSNVYRIRMGGDKLSPGVVTNQTVGGDIFDGAIRKNRPEPSKTLTPPNPPLQGGNGSHNSTARTRRRREQANEPCTLHPDSGLTAWGTCWQCYSLKHSGERATQ